MICKTNKVRETASEHAEKNFWAPCPQLPKPGLQLYLATCRWEREALSKEASDRIGLLCTVKIRTAQGSPRGWDTWKVRDSANISVERGFCFHGHCRVAPPALGNCSASPTMLLSDPIQGHPAFCSTTDRSLNYLLICSSWTLSPALSCPWCWKKGPSTCRELLYPLTLLSSSTVPLTPQMLSMTLAMYLAWKRPDKENTRYQILTAEWAPTVGDGPWAHSSVSGSGESAAKLWQSWRWDHDAHWTTPAEGERGIFKKPGKWPRDKVYEKKNNGYIPNS